MKEFKFCDAVFFSEVICGTVGLGILAKTT